MDSLTLIALVSIVMAGLTTGFGTMGPALAEGRAVATALTSLAQPILRAIAAREQLIAAQLADAAGQKAEAQRERAEFEDKNQAFEAQRATLLSEAVAQVQLERQRLLDNARQAAEAMS